MAAYYNEIEPYAADWLRALIKEGLIAPGEVDTRSIVDVRPDDLNGFQQCHFFAGLGGWAGALRLAGFPDDRPVWTGSCPCQPFSLAGKQKGFDDARHLWPVWKGLVAERRPPKVYGEQVASASDWLRLVRSDLEALEYAVGAMPIEAASAGADHLRDRFWFVGNAAGDGEWRPRQPGSSGEPQVPFGRHGALAMADANHERSQGRQVLPECANQRLAGPDGVDMADAGSNGAECGAGDSPSAQGEIERQHWRASRTSFAPRLDGEIEWIIGADGKARRVKPGIRLLAHGVPARVAKLRALGNAIDLRPAAAFIKATM